jgi:cytochrome c oxidase cbb3-type subunit 3
VKFAKLRITAVCVVVAISLMNGCGRLPGKPSELDRWSAPAAVTDFNQLYSQNCAGCHGANGSLGAATNLNDPLYLALIGPVAMRQVISTGVPGTAMPAFSAQSGGTLTDKQLDSLVAGMSSAWGRPNEFNQATLPPYSLQDAAAKGLAFGEASRGAAVYQTYCAQCHGVEGGGGPKGGSIVDPNFLALVSDQHLRTTVIAGRPDLGKPDWRTNVSGTPMSPQEISDVVAWLSAKRTNTLAFRSAPSLKEQLSEVRGRALRFIR